MTSSKIGFDTGFEPFKNEFKASSSCTEILNITALLSGDTVPKVLVKSAIF